MIYDPFSPDAFGMRKRTDRFHSIQACFKGDNKVLGIDFTPGGWYGAKDMILGPHSRDNPVANEIKKGWKKVGDKFEPPKMPDPAAPAPPVSERTREVMDAKRQSQLDAKKRKGIRATLLAGETGGYRPMKQSGQAVGATLLGG